MPDICDGRRNDADFVTKGPPPRGKVKRMISKEEEASMGKSGELEGYQEVGEAIENDIAFLNKQAAKIKDFDPSKQEADGGGLRFSEGKNRVELVRPLMVWGLANVFTRGSIKYAANNWMRGMEWGEVLGPLKRHVLKWEAGEVYDKDTGCHHMFMVAWNAFVLAFYQLLGLGTNNLGTKFDTDFNAPVSEIDAFDSVNNKPEAQYRKEIEEQKKKRNDINENG